MISHLGFFIRSLLQKSVAFKQQFQLNKMYLLRSTIYATQIIFILSLTNFELGKATPYWRVMGISRTKGHPIWNEQREDVSNNFVSSLNGDLYLRKQILEALQDQWQLMVKTFGRSELERGLYRMRSLRNLRL